jgi:hypothetical protein
VPFTKAVTTVTGTSPRKRNGDMSAGYWRPAGLRRVKCDMAQNRNTGIKEVAVARQRRGKNFSAATNEHTTIH